MTIDDFENIFSLMATIIGLLSVVFRYIEIPKRGMLFIAIFFMSHFLSDYYWSVYALIVHDYPDVSEFFAYFGWNVAYLFLFLVILQMRKEGARRYFHPLMLLPLLVNGAQFVLYIQYGAILNNIWQVGMTTLIMILCLQDILYYKKNKKYGIKFPKLSTLVLLFLICEYVMWTSSCFGWSSEFINPYLYFTIISSIMLLFFGSCAKGDYINGGIDVPTKSMGEIRFQTMLQLLVSFVIFGGCAGGYFFAKLFKDYISEDIEEFVDGSGIVLILFAISLILVLLILLLLYEISFRYRLARENKKDFDGRRSKFNLIFTTAITLALMVFAVIYNTKVFYDASVSGVYEDGENRIKSNATELENYLSGAETTLRVAADTIDLMLKSGKSKQEIYQYLLDQTRMQSEQFDENFTGIYAYVDGNYLDGSGWIPDADYDPETRDWYKAADTEGEVVIVSPYVDAQTNKVVITVAKCIPDNGTGAVSGRHNVVCLDVIVNHIQEITEQVEISEKGYGMVINNDGFIVAHHDSENNGSNIKDVYNSELLNIITNTGAGRVDVVLDDEECTLFINPIMNQWYSVIVISDSELLENVHSQVAINIIVSLILTGLISFFYFLGYKNEQAYGKRVEELNIEVVGSLAASIDAKDKYTNGHSSRVAEYSKMIAEKAGYSEKAQEDIYMMGLLHDVGKIGIPDDVINKPGKLTDEEFELIKQHSVIGCRILEGIKERPLLAVGARSHHERYDGTGYPDGLAGENIPEEARIIAVADAYDAMTSKRIYRDVMPQEKVRSEVERGRGTQFDPRFADIMLKLIDEDTSFSRREIDEEESKEL